MTVSEAKKTITEAISAWEGAGEQKKIVSLAAWALRWSNKEGGPKARATEMNKDLNSLKALIRRGKNVGKNVAYYEGELATQQEEFAAFVLEHNITFEKKTKKVKE